MMILMQLRQKRLTVKEYLSGQHITLELATSYLRRRTSNRMANASNYPHASTEYCSSRRWSSRKTVITLDMGLYQPSKKLQMARNDLNNIILRVGELHVTIAQLRTIGAYIEDSGIDMCWSKVACMAQLRSGKYWKATMLSEANRHTWLLFKPFSPYTKKNFSRALSWILRTLQICVRKSKTHVAKEQMKMSRSQTTG
ncbi:hypothetical protein OS493_030047 [Desmophyllum pertusum]|uniref:Uncharacterized protein n=1 Tax=Desmophyllum pertusum TaxID=174260 RepID=A0A9W9Z8Q1_9CNID|nr:hypothetical protein OS493_030047 [Desmophyllum pertusum]